MVTLKAPSLEKKDVIEALYLLLGQDYKGGRRNLADGAQAIWLCTMAQQPCLPGR